MISLFLQQKELPKCNNGISFTSEVFTTRWHRRRISNKQPAMICAISLLGWCEQMHPGEAYTRLKLKIKVLVGFKSCSTLKV